uniref:Uncharacterized protein n=1 Tax=Plectus sambesii TaxID=2011161 RepID=A0A914XPV7_9BILA
MTTNRLDKCARQQRWQGFERSRRVTSMGAGWKRTVAYISNWTPYPATSEAATSARPGRSAVVRERVVNIRSGPGSPMAVAGPQCTSDGRRTHVRVTGRHYTPRTTGVEAVISRSIIASLSFRTFVALGRHLKRRNHQTNISTLLTRTHLHRCFMACSFLRDWAYADNIYMTRGLVTSSWPDPVIGHAFPLPSSTAAVARA